MIPGISSRQLIQKCCPSLGMVRKKTENVRSSCFLGGLNRSFIQNVVLVLQVGEFHFDMRCEEMMEQMVISQ